MNTDVSLAIVFRTFDTVWDCEYFDRRFHNTHWEPCLVKGSADLSNVSDIPLSICVEDISSFPDLNLSENHNPPPVLVFPGIPGIPTDLRDLVNQCIKSSFYRPHRRFVPKVLPHGWIPSNMCHSRASEQNGFVKIVQPNSLEGDIKRYSHVVPRRRCVVVTDAHLAGCLKSAVTSCPSFCERFVLTLNHLGGFQRILHQNDLTQNKPRRQDGGLAVKVFIEVFAVWPWQVIDSSWSKRILGLLNKHMVLEEGLAWLSTLGGAHSSLGETFLHHAKRAGEISVHQMRLARDLGNEVMIARCYLYWAWSLLQRGHLAQSKTCVRNTWKYCQQLRYHDKVLENMCRAVWNRLRYEAHRRRHLQKVENLGRNGTTHDTLLTDSDRRPHS